MSLDDFSPHSCSAPESSGETRKTALFEGSYRLSEALQALKFQGFKTQW